MAVVHLPSLTRCWARNTVLACSLLGLASEARPASSTFVYGDGTDNVTLAVNVPQNGTNDVFFHFNAPASTSSWAAFGFGGQMHGALIFVVYKSEDGESVTVSPRLGVGHQEPQHTDNVSVAVFSGSGVDNGVFNVNGMCLGCRSWSSGSIDVTSEKAEMIWAIGPATTLASSDLNASISQHQTHGSFDMNLVQATGVGGVPIIDDTSTNSSSGSSSSTTSGWYNTPGAAVHGLLMVLAFLIIFPGGVLLLRLFDPVWLHLGMQSLGAFVVAFSTAVGIAVSKRDQIHPKINAPHQIIGLIIFVLVLATWCLGLVSHLIFRRTGQPAKLMLGHRALGPLAVVLGLINVCLGFHFAGRDRPIIGFVVMATIMIIIVASGILLRRRRAVRKGAMHTAAAMKFRAAGPSLDAPPAYSAPAVPLESLGRASDR